jgi:hypothetical protein
VTTPVAEPTATITLLADHVPPVVALVRVMLLPKHTPDGPAIAAGKGLTVIVLTEKQMPATVYVITDVPVVIPVTIPVAASILTLALLADHTPPAGDED